MLILSPDLLLLLQRCVNTAYFFRVIPFKWSNCAARVYVPITSKWNLYKWDVTVRLMFVYQVFVCIRFYQSISEVSSAIFQHDFNLSPNFTPIIIEGQHVVSVIAVCVFQFTMLHFKGCLVNCINHFIALSKSIEDKYSRRDVKLEIPSWQREIQFLVKLLVIAGITNSIFGAILLVKYPNAKVFLSSIIFPEHLISEEPSLWVSFIGGFIHLWTFLALWNCVFAFAAIYPTFIYAHIFVLQEMRCAKSSRFTSNQLRKPSKLLHVYKSLQILNKEFNGLTRPYLLLAINNAMLVVSVGGQIVAIELHGKLSIETLTCILSLSFGAAGYLILSYFKLGQVSENSRKCLESWKKNAGLHLELRDKILALRYIRSMSVCKIELGSFGYFRKANSLKIVEKIIYFTVKGAVLLQKFI